jgi:hypothetical protein
MESLPILKMAQHHWCYSRFPLRSFYKKRYSVSSAICVLIHSLILSFILSIHFSWSPHLKTSPMKQGTNQTFAVRVAPSRRKAYIQWGAVWFSKGRAMVLRFIFKILGLITIILISNKNLTLQTLIHCSRFVIRARARTHTHKHTHTHIQNTTAVAASIIPIT